MSKKYVQAYTLLNLEQLRNNLQDKRLYVIAEKTNLTYPTLKGLADGTNNNPSYETVMVLSKYFAVPKTN